MKPNVVLMIIDTLRADYAAPLYREAEKQGWTAHTAIAPATWTLPSCISMFTGLYPSQHKVDETAPPSRDARKARIAMKATNYGILSKLKREGYHTYIFTANPYLTPYFGFSLYDELFFLRSYKHTVDAFNAIAREGTPLKAGIRLLKEKKIRTLALAASKYLTLQIAKNFPHLHRPGPPRDKGHIAIEKKLQETELKEPYFVVVHLMEAHSPYTRLEGWVELSYLVPKIYSEQLHSGRAPKWAQKIWQEAYPKHAEYAAQVGARIARRFSEEAIVIVTADHGEMLREGVFHGLPPNDELAIVPFIATIPLQKQGVISLTEIPHLIEQLVQGQDPIVGSKYAKTEYYESPLRHKYAKKRKIARYYMLNGVYTYQS